VKRKYYCLVAGLQDINLDVHKLNFDQKAFKEYLKEEVHPKDFQLVEKLFLPYDNKNLLILLQKEDKEFNDKGNFSREFLEENIKEPTDALPEYMRRFIIAYKNKEPLFPDLSPENELTTLFYDAMLKLDNDFLRNWYQFNLNIRNITTALAARKHELPYENQIIGTGEISETIRKSHARDFGLGSELDYMEDLMNVVRQDDIQVREKAMDQIRWEYLDEVTFFEYFTIERVLAFTIKLGMVERWLGIDVDHGREIFRKLLSELQSSYELPKTFKEK
jgi:hypothetical protein